MKTQLIQNRIYMVRGQRVMLDFDLARIYGTQTRALKQAIKRNISRFPKDFMFQLTKKEWLELITNCDKLPESIRFSPALPYAFNEHGVTMLASVLKSEKAIRMNIAVVRAFVALKQFALSYKELEDKIKELQATTGTHNLQLQEIFAVVQQLLGNKEQAQFDWQHRERIGFKKPSNQSTGKGSSFSPKTK